MTARRRRTSRCKVARAMFWNNLRDGEVSKELCFLCLFLCCILKPTRWQESHQRLDSDQLFFYYTSPPAKKQPHVFCWIPAVFLSHFFLAQPWHCVALRYITEVKKQQSSRGKKKRYAGLRVDYDRCKLISETSPLSSASQKKHRAAEWNAQPVGEVSQMAKLPS